MMSKLSVLIAAALLGAMPAMPASTTADKLAPDRQRAAHDMFEHLVNIPTVFGRGNVPTLANYLADQYRAAGFPADDVRLVPYDSTDPVGHVTDKTAALIIRWRASGKARGKPVMLMGHMDVVEAKREDWTRDPFTLVEEDGYFYGRGTADNKGQHSINLAALAAVRAARGGRLGFNAKFIVEMGEEIGSPDLREVCVSLRDELKADLFLASDVRPQGRRLQADTRYCGVLYRRRRNQRHRCRQGRDRVEEGP